MRRIYIVAEADAGDRESWPGPDRLRPITRDGWRQARAVAEHMRGRRPGSIVASPWLRCRQTLQPLAEAVGLDVGEDRALAETAPVARVLDRLVELPDGSVVCTHAEIVREIVAASGARREGVDIGPWVLELRRSFPAFSPPLTARSIASGQRPAGQRRSTFSEGST